MKSEANITRLDYARTHAWWVRFQRGYDAAGRRKVIGKMFSDLSHGGKRKALAAAVAWRDRTAPGLPARLLRHPARVAPGYGYVKRTELKRRVGYGQVWVGWIRLEAGRARATSYSVARWGERGARQKCEDWLARQRRELKGRKER